MARRSRVPDETLRLWHCPTCGYANAGRRACNGCHKRAPRSVRANTKNLLASIGRRRSAK